MNPNTAAEIIIAFFSPRGSNLLQRIRRKRISSRIGKIIPTKIAESNKFPVERFVATGFVSVFPLNVSTKVIIILLNEAPVCIKVKQMQSAAKRCENFIFSLIGRIFGNGESARSATTTEYRKCYHRCP